MKHKTQNGWTKARMIQQIQTHMMGHRSQDANKDNCVYRAADGNKCAVGCFIPDAVYKESFEHTTIKDFISVIGHHMPLSLHALYLLQTVHDDAEENDPRPLVIKWIEENVEDA